MHGIKLNVATTMRVTVLASALVTAVFTAPAMANDQYSDAARVLSVTPQTERVNMPRQECRTEYQQQSYSNNNQSIAGAVIGGVAGGLLGSTIGRGNGRVAAAAVGAGVGAMAGNSIGNNQNNGVTTRSVPVQNCYQVDNWQTVNSGYLVTYEYNGRTYSTVTDTRPGNTIDVNVAVSPSRRAPSQVTYIEPIREPIRYTESGWNDRRDHGRHRGWDNRRDDDGDGRYY